MSEKENTSVTEEKDEVPAEETDPGDISPENETVEEPEAESPSAEDIIEELNQKLADADEKYKRLDAEYYNYRMRSLKEKQDAAADSTAKTVSEILSVIDNFERAAAAETSDETYKKGVEMIFSEFCNILKKLGVEEINPVGEPFDPNFHNAVSQTEDENFGENTVCQVYQKGYKLGSKVIRFATVVVANP